VRLDVHSLMNVCMLRSSFKQRVSDVFDRTGTSMCCLGLKGTGDVWVFPRIAALPLSQDVEGLPVVSLAHTPRQAGRERYSGVLEPRRGTALMMMIQFDIDRSACSEDKETRRCDQATGDSWC
jgi:hypothetical protein